MEPKFDKLLEKYWSLVTEQPDMGMGPQTPQAPPPVPMGGPELGAAAPGGEPTMPDDEAEREVEPLTSEGEVMLIRLIKKALVMEIDEDAALEVDEIGDINEKNAKSVLEKLVSIMKNYSSELDIDL